MRPITRDLARRKGSTQSGLGKFRGVLTFERCAAPPPAQRRVLPGRLFVVANEEIWAKLRRRQEELASALEISKPHWKQDHAHTRRQNPNTQKPPSHRRVVELNHKPDGDGDKKDQGILTVQ